MHPCKSVADCEHIMAMGWKNRSVGATLMNADSSRSHSIFSIHMERCDADDSGEEHIRAAKLNLVDLAGSERQGKTGNNFVLILSTHMMNLKHFCGYVINSSLIIQGYFNVMGAILRLRCTL